MPAATLTAALIVAPFPQPGDGLRLLYRQLETAQHGDLKQRQALGDPERLGRPWVPETLNASQRGELWTWLEVVVPWFNEHYTWCTSDLIPPCWPKHPHIVLEVLTVADQRYRAGLAFTGGDLEEWHRYCVPAFVDRMRARLTGSCSEGHQTWPGRARIGGYNDHLSRREDRFIADTHAWRERGHPTGALYDYDPTTGEIIDH